MAAVSGVLITQSAACIYIGNREAAVLQSQIAYPECGLSLN